MLLIFQELSKDMTWNFIHYLSIQLLANVESLITLSTELTKLAAFNHGKFVVETSSKTVSTIQDSASTVNVNTFWVEKKFIGHNVFHHPTRQTISKTWDNIIGPAEKTDATWHEASYSH